MTIVRKCCDWLVIIFGMYVDENNDSSERKNNGIDRDDNTIGSVVSVQLAEILK